MQGLLDFIYTRHYPFEFGLRDVIDHDIDKDVIMYSLGDKYMVPELQAKAGESFREKVNYICGDSYQKNVWGDVETDEVIFNAIRFIYEELPDDDWTRFYLVQHMFQARAKFLSCEKFKEFLKDHEGFGSDFIEELAWDSKLWEWRRECRNHSRPYRGRGRGYHSSGQWLSSCCEQTASNIVGTWTKTE